MWLKKVENYVRFAKDLTIFLEQFDKYVQKYVEGEYK